MLSAKFALKSFASQSRSTAWRSFSKTSSVLADQYDVVVVGKSKVRSEYIIFLVSLSFAHKLFGIRIPIGNYY